MEVTTYTDDCSITDDECLWRRIPPRHFFFDENLGRFRPSKAAFEDSTNGHPMSVVLEDMVIKSHRTPRDVLHGHDDFALARLTVGLVRMKNQGVQRDPISGEPAHALVFGNKTDSVKRAFAKECEWVVAPHDGAES